MSASQKPNQLRVLICGSRDWTDEDLVLRRLKTLKGDRHPEEVTVIHGACKGADHIAGLVAQSLGFRVVAVPADWKKYGKAAVPIRNRKMLELDPHYVIAFHDDLDSSRGTKDMVNAALDAGLMVEVLGKTKV